MIIGTFSSSISIFLLKMDHFASNRLNEHSIGFLAGLGMLLKNVISILVMIKFLYVKGC